MLGVAVGASGGQSKDFGFTGVGIFNSIDNHTTASVGGRATIDLGGDATISATDTTLPDHGRRLDHPGREGRHRRLRRLEPGVARHRRPTSATPRTTRVSRPAARSQSDGALDISASNDGFIGAFARRRGLRQEQRTTTRDRPGDRRSRVGGRLRAQHARTTRRWPTSTTRRSPPVETSRSTPRTRTIVEALSIGGALARGNVNSVALAGAASTNTVDATPRRSSRTATTQPRRSARRHLDDRRRRADGERRHPGLRAGRRGLGRLGNQDDDQPTATRSAIDRRLGRDQRDRHRRPGTPCWPSSRTPRSTPAATSPRRRPPTASSTRSRSAARFSSAAGGSVSDTALAGAAAGAFASNVVTTVARGVHRRRQQGAQRCRRVSLRERS